MQTNTQLARGIARERFTGAARAQEATPVGTDQTIKIFNVALSLEHIEAAFYRVALKKFDVADFEALGYQAGVRDSVAEIAAHEKAHVTTLVETIRQLGGTPVEASQYRFGYGTLQEFLQVAAALEAIAVAAYGGVLQSLLGEQTHVTTALTIQGVEARHASYLNVVTGVDPFPAAFEKPMAEADVKKAIESLVTVVQ
jgi:hypothetical protein